MKLSKRTSKYFLGLSLVLALTFNANLASAKGYESSASLKQRIEEHKIDYIARIIKTYNKQQTSAKQLARIIVNVSEELKFDPLLTTAIIKAESTFKIKARSNKGAMGLMQLMPTTGKYVAKIMNTNWQGIYRLHDVEYNIRLGVRYYKYLHEKFHENQVFALIAYNWGPSNTVKAYRGQKYIPRCSSRYARQISDLKEKWSAEYASEFQKLFT